MALKDLKKVSSENKDVQKTQDNLEIWAKQIMQCPIINGVLLKNVELTSGTNIVEHKLGRTPIDCLVLTPQTACIVHKEVSSQPSKVLKLVASADTTVSIWVF